MGTNLKQLINPKEIDFAYLKDKIVAIDAFNYLYQFLTTIRQYDGSLLTDSKGRVTSHLNGLFFRTSKLLEHGIKPIFVFDGKYPEIKKEERKRRRELKEQAMKKLREATEISDFKEMKKYAQRTTSLNTEMVEQSKRLIELMGLPWVQAPCEGEAQACHLVKKGDAYAVVSQDYDSLLFGAPRLVRNLSIEGRRKRGAFYVNVRPVIITLADMLNELGIDNEKLIVLAMLVGTDYCKGVPGIGPKKALKLVKEMEKEEIFEKVEWSSHCEHSWKRVFDTITKMEKNDDYILEWREPDVDAIRKMLVDEFEFSEKRIEKRLRFKKKEQLGLGQWLAH